MNIKNTQEQIPIFFNQDGSNFYEQVECLEKLMINSGSPDIVVGNSEALPLTHTFCDGVYVREIFLKQGVVAIGKIHKHNHVFFLLKGKLMLCTENGVQEMIAPCYGKSPAGTKRVVVAVEDSVFVNVHPNPENEEDVEKLEQKFVVSSFEEYNKIKKIK